MYFNLVDLIEIAAKALENWIVDLNRDPAQRQLVLERYDNTLSDVRFTMWKFDC